MIPVGYEELSLQDSAGTMSQRRTMVRNSCEHYPPSTHTYVARLQPSTHAQEGP